MGKGNEITTDTVRLIGGLAKYVIPSGTVWKSDEVLHYADAEYKKANKDDEEINSKHKVQFRYEFDEPITLAKLVDKVMIPQMNIAAKASWKSAAETATKESSLTPDEWLEAKYAEVKYIVSVKVTTLTEGKAKQSQLTKLTKSISDADFKTQVALLSSLSGMSVEEAEKIIKAKMEREAQEVEEDIKAEAEAIDKAENPEVEEDK